MQIKDFYKEALIDKLNIPMRLFKPYVPVHLEVTAAHRENPTSKYKIFVSLVLETVVQSDKLVAVVVSGAQFTPAKIPNITGFSFLLGTRDFEVGSFPFLQVNP